MHDRNSLKISDSMIAGIKSSGSGFGFVYMLIKNGTCVYVGQTTDLRLRVGSHILSGKDFDSVRADEFTASELNNEEANAIVRLTPELNKKLPKSDNFVTKWTLAKDIADAVISSIIDFEYVGESKSGSCGYVSANVYNDLMDKVKLAISK